MNGNSQSDPPVTVQQVTHTNGRLWGTVIAGMRWYSACLTDEIRDFEPQPGAPRYETREAVSPVEPRVQPERRAVDAPKSGRARISFKKRSWRWGRVPIVYLLLAMGLGLAVTATVRHDKLAAHLRSLTGPHFEAPPFFRLDAFRALEPGMTESEVRESIGYPLDRRGVDNVTTHCYYTQPASADDIRFLLCVAIFGQESHRLIRTKEIWQYSGLGLQRIHNSMIPHTVGDIEFVQADGVVHQVRASGPTYLIVRNETVSSALGQVAQASEAQGTPPVGMVQLFDLRNDDASGLTVDNRGVFAKSSPTLPEAFDKVSCVYSGGTVYTPPPVYECYPESGADREWLIRKLASRPTLNASD